MADSDEFKFNITWYDELACQAREYMLTVFESPRVPTEICIRDVKKKQTFLKRTISKDIQLEQMFKGAKVLIHARIYEVVGYGDSATRSFFESHRSLITCILPSRLYADFGAAIQLAQRSGFTVTKLKTFFDRHDDISLAVELMGPVQGDDLWSLVFSGSSNPNMKLADVRYSNEETDSIFNEPSTTARLDEYSSLLLIKPHAMKEGNTGAILSSVIDANFEISAIQTFQLSRVEVENFTEVYNGVLEPPSLYSSLTSELSSGQLVAVEVRAENCVEELRKLAGYYDVEVAQQLEPKSLRARFGHDKVKNAVHVTDLPEDGVLESQYFFDIIIHTAKNSHK